MEKNLFVSLYLVIVLNLFQIARCERVTSDDENNCPKFPNQPKITILSDEKDFLAGDGRYMGNKTLSIQCTAAYPIYWNFSPPDKSIIGMLSKVKQNCYNETMTLAMPIYYVTSANIGRTGNYSCISGLDGSVSNWIFLHIKENKDLFVRKFKLGHEASYAGSVENDFWSIPCIATLKNLENVTLYHHYNETYELEDLPKFNTSDQFEYDEIQARFNESEIVNGTSYFYEDGLIHFYSNSVTTPATTEKMVRLNVTAFNYSKYDPKYGFLLKKSEFSRPNGKFVCKGVFKNETDLLELELKTYNVIPASEYVTYTNNNTIELTCESDEDINFDLTKAYRLRTVSSSKSSTNSFKYSVKVVLQEQVELRSMSYYQLTYLSTSGLISCVTVANSSNVLHTWHHDFSKSCSCKMAGPSPGQITGAKSSSGLYYSSLVTGSCTANSNIAYFTQYYVDTVTQPMTQLVQKYSYGTFSFWSPSKITSLGGRGLATTKSYTATYMTCAVGNFVTHSLLVPTISGFRANPGVIAEDNSHLAIYMRESDVIEYFVGDVMEIWCIASLYHFSDSISWILNYKNGTSVNQKEQKNFGNGIYLSTSYQIPQKWAYVQKFEVEMNPHLKSISCSAVVWNSTEIVTAKYSVELNNTINNQQPIKVVAPDKLNKCDPTSDNPIIQMQRLTTGILQARLRAHDVTDTSVTVHNVLSGSQVKLRCLAEFPTEWTFQGDEMKFNSPSRIDTGMTNSSISPCFLTERTLSTSISSIGEYICRKKNDHSRFSSVYIFGGGSRVTARFTNPGSHISINVDTNDAVTILPCRVTVPDASVDLYYHDASPVYRKLKIGEYESYDPKKGFFLKTSLIKKSAVYICTMTNALDPQSSITISVTVNNCSLSSKGGDMNSLSNELSKTQHEFFTLQVFMIVILFSGFAALIWLFRRRNNNNDDDMRNRRSYFPLHNSTATE